MNGFLRGSEMTMLFEALKRAGCGENNQGIVLIDGSRACRHWVEDGTVFFESGAKDAAFTDQDIQFDDCGVANAADTNDRLREVRVLVMVPFSAKLQTLDLIHPPKTKAN
jgi:hypothetical protein